MSFLGKPLALAVGAVALSGTALVPVVPALLISSSAQAQEVSFKPAPIVAEQPEVGPITVAEPEPEAAPAAAEIDEGELTCLAKVVLHESGNQPRQGQLAVAQVVLNRLNDPRGRFGRTVCGVVMQRGQFFNVHAYNPRRDQRWQTAMSIAREAMTGAEPVIGNALFFHASHASPFRGRTRVGRIGGHVFYR